MRSGLSRVLRWSALAVPLLWVSSSFAAPGEPTPADALETLPGFKVEVVHKADKAVESWISLAKDKQGRLLLGSQRNQPATRVTLKDGKVEKAEQIKLPISEIMGSLYAFDSLYLSGSNGKIFGLFRLKENPDGTFGEPELLREFKGGSGEHGAHGIVLSPDKKSLLIVAGNFVKVPEDVAATSPHRNYADDLALPRAEDGNGFGAGNKPPGGYVLKVDPDGKNAELFGSGQRNTYDIAMNADGELFGWDSDMEWDWGTPWYRPVRVGHVSSGADHGFREGNAKYPEYYADSLPAAVTIGIGCPTGAVFGYGAKFPAKYQKALYILDWTYGRLIAVHLTPSGSSYAGHWENLVAPAGLRGPKKQSLNLTDAVVGDDGALYFTVGGRNTQAGLYRVTYTGAESTAAVDAHDKEGADLRDLRHKLEAFHHTPDPKAIETVWPQLGNADRFIRYAARIAIERQPVEQWKQKALDEKDPQAALTALLALARYGAQTDQADLLKALGKFPTATLPEPLQLDKLRVIEVSIARQGKPSPEACKTIAEKLSPLYPAKSIPLNRELCQVLIAVGAPDAIAKTVKLMQEAPTQEEKLTYVVALRQQKEGWTQELRKDYFSFWTMDRSKFGHPDYVLKWFEDAGRPFSDGSSFNNFLKNINAEARKTLTPDEEKNLADVLAAYTPGGKPAKPAKPQKLVKQYTMGDLEPGLAAVEKGRSYNKGKAAYEAAQCAACHRFGNEGGATGPDLTAIASRFKSRDVLESIVEPSKVISEQYQNQQIKTLQGDEPIIGRVIEEKEDALIIQPDPLKPDKVTVKKKDIKSRGPSKLSPMPEGLVNVLTKDEIYDLIAYLNSGGNKSHPAFSK